MNRISIQSKTLLHSMIRLLVQYLEVADRIPDDDFKEIVQRAQNNKRYTKNVMDNLERGNLFMTVFFLRELIESITHDDTTRQG